MHFSKPALTIDEQIDLLRKRGLVIPERDKAHHYLTHLNYYRLGAYWLPFEADHSTHQFIPETHFDDVLNLYLFDRELRLLLLDAIERIEVSVRAVWAHEMSQRHGPHCHLNATLFKPDWDYRQNYRQNYRAIKNAVDRSKESFIIHLTKKYSETLPPIWATVEVMMLGQLSQWYKNTLRRTDRNAVAKRYSLDEKILSSLLHHLTIVRNICAHHARLWNKEFTIIPKLPKKSIPATSTHDKRKIYNTLVFIVYLMNQISPNHRWKTSFLDLLNHHKIDTTQMGFPQAWKTYSLWLDQPHQ